MLTPERIDMLISVKTTRLDDSQNGIKGLATVSFGDAFKVQSMQPLKQVNTERSKETIIA